MLSDALKNIQKMPLEDVNKDCMEIAREIAKDFTMEDYGDMTSHIMNLAKERMESLGSKLDTETEMLYYVAMVAEIFLYLGIKLGRIIPAPTKKEK